MNTENIILILRSGTRWSVRSPPTQAFLWSYNMVIWSSILPQNLLRHKFRTHELLGIRDLLTFNMGWMKRNFFFQQYEKPLIWDPVKSICRNSVETVMLRKSTLIHNISVSLSIYYIICTWTSYFHYFAPKSLISWVKWLIISVLLLVVVVLLVFLLHFY